MPKRSSINEPPDEAQLAKSILDELTIDVDDITPDAPESKPGKNLAAVTLGRLGGLKGGKARAEKLSPKRRKAIAKEGRTSQMV